MADLRLGRGASFAVCAPYLTIRCVVGAKVCCYDNLWSVQQLLSFHALDGKEVWAGDVAVLSRAGFLAVAHTTLESFA